MGSEPNIFEQWLHVFVLKSDPNEKKKTLNETSRSY